MTTDKLREAFEAYHRAEGTPGIFLHRDHKGDYVELAESWKDWQACAAHLQPEIDALQKQVGSYKNLADAIDATKQGLRERAANALLTAEIDRLRKDAERYRWLRLQHWHDSTLAVVLNPRESIKLGYTSPSKTHLDELIDEALKGSGPERTA